MPWVQPLWSWDHIFHKVCLIINTFSPLCETLFAGCIKVFAEALELFTLAVFQLVIVDKTATSGRILQGAKSGSRWVLNRDCREDEGEESSPFFALASFVRRLMCGVWRCHCRNRSTFFFLFGRTLRIRCFNFFSNCIYRSQLIVTPLSKKSANKVPSLVLNFLPCLVGPCGPVTFPFYRSEPTSMASSLHTLLRRLWISIGMERSVVEEFYYHSLPRTYVYNVCHQCVERTWLEHRWS